MNTPKLPPLPKPDTHCFDDDTGKDVWSHSPAQMQAYAIAAIEAQDNANGVVVSQGIPDGSALQIEAAVIQAQKVLSDWNEWYGLNGGNAPLPPSGIVKAQEMLAEVRSLLASAPPVPPQAQLQPLSDYEFDEIG